MRTAAYTYVYSSSIAIHVYVRTMVLEYTWTACPTAITAAGGGSTAPWTATWTSLWVRIADEPLHGILADSVPAKSGAARCLEHDAVAKVLTTRLRSLPGVTVVEEPPAPTEALPGARADLKVEVKARKWLIDVAIVCPATKAVVARPGVSAKAGEAVKRKKYKGAVQGFVVEAGGRLGLAAKKFIHEVVAESQGSAKCQRWRGKQRRAR